MSFMSVVRAEIMTLDRMESCLLASSPAANHHLSSDLILFHCSCLLNQDPHLFAEIEFY